MSASHQKDFHELLLRYSQEPESINRQAIEAELWDRYGQTITVMVVDMSGFTRLSRDRGIVHYLSMVRRMQLTAKPIIESYLGQVVRFEADNAFARFPGPAEAIRAAVALNLATGAANLLTESELDIHLSCGIDHGPCLVPDDQDFWGMPVVHASKLGEDLGQPGQILVTDEAFQQVDATYPFESHLLTLEIGGKPVEVHSIKYSRE